MQSAAAVKNEFQPLLRDLHNLGIFVNNINHIMQAGIGAAGPTAPPGITTVRRAIKSLMAAISAMREVNNLAIEKGAETEHLAEGNMVPVLHPATSLLTVALDLKEPIDSAWTQLGSFHGQLMPFFIFATSNVSVIEFMADRAGALEGRINELKKAVNWLVEQEDVSGLPETIATRLSILQTDMRALGLEVADINQSLAQLILQMDRVNLLSAQLQPVVKMAAAADGFMQDLKPAMRLLKHYGQILAEVKFRSSNETLQTFFEQRFAKRQFPDDALVQLRFQLKRQVEHYILPVTEPLADVAHRLNDALPDPDSLNSMENVLMVQSTRFIRVAEQVEDLCYSLRRVFEDAREITHAA